MAASGSWRWTAGVLAIVAVAMPGRGQVAAPPPLPVQHIVFVIDNSGSMEMASTPSDPLKLRGVAASLILDAAELSSQVQAGLVHFSDKGDTDGQLHSADVIRQRLQADRLPSASGGTHMEDGLAKAIGILDGSSAEIRRIVMITDGMPSDVPGRPATEQVREILETLVPHVQRAGIQVFALALSKQVDQAFLDRITGPTGGKTLVSEKHQTLLESAKALIGDRDNVFTLANEALPSAQTDFEFELPPGVDRARLTLILDQPQAFAPSELTLALRGPDAGDGGRTYNVKADGRDRVAAWTTFFGAAGKYTLHVDVQKPGAPGHLGMRVFLEALSNLQVGLTLRPEAPNYTFGDAVEVEVSATTSSGSVDKGSLRISGVVMTPGGGAQPIAFNGTRGTFQVPDVAGRHEVVVKVQTASVLGRATGRKAYQAVPRQPAELKSSRSELRLPPLGPTQPSVEESFQLLAAFPEGVSQRPVRITCTLSSPVGHAELRRADGTALRANGIATYTLPVEGMELRLRIALDPRRPLPTTAGKVYPGRIRFETPDGAPLEIPFQLQLRIPRFEVVAQPEALTLWWDPRRPRTVALGRLHTDLETASTFTVVLPDALHAPEQGPKMAALALRVGGQAPPAGDSREVGKLAYGPIDLPPGRDLPLELVITPVVETEWERLAASPQPFEVQLRSSLGMEAVVVPTFWNVGGAAYELPWLLGGTLSRHGRDASTVTWMLLALLSVLVLAVLRGREVKRFWKYRPGELVTLRSGAIAIDDPRTSGSATGLVLPRSGSELDGTVLGRASVAGRRQQVQDTSRRLLLRGRRPIVPTTIAAGDRLTVLDPSVEDEAEPLWELESLDFDPGEGGDFDVLTSPAPWTLGRLVRRLVVVVLLVFLVRSLLGSGPVAAGAYRLPWVESLYVRALQP